MFDVSEPAKTPGESSSRDTKASYVTKRLPKQRDSGGMDGMNDRSPDFFDTDSSDTEESSGNIDASKTLSIGNRNPPKDHNFDSSEHTEDHSDAIDVVKPTFDTLDIGISSQKSSLQSGHSTFEEGSQSHLQVDTDTEPLRRSRNNITGRDALELNTTPPKTSSIITTQGQDRQLSRNTADELLLLHSMTQQAILQRNGHHVSNTGHTHKSPPSNSIHSFPPAGDSSVEQQTLTNHPPSIMRNASSKRVSFLDQLHCTPAPPSRHPDATPLSPYPRVGPSKIQKPLKHQLMRANTAPTYLTSNQIVEPSKSRVETLQISPDIPHKRGSPAIPQSSIHSASTIDTSTILVLSAARRYSVNGRRRTHLVIPSETQGVTLTCKKRKFRKCDISAPIETIDRVKERSLSNMCPGHTKVDFDDAVLFYHIRSAYYKNLLGASVCSRFWRRWFGPSTLKLIQYVASEEVLDRGELLKHFWKPKLGKGYDRWVKWARRVAASAGQSGNDDSKKKNDSQLFIDGHLVFVEGPSIARILTASIIVKLCSIAVCVSYVCAGPLHEDRFWLQRLGREDALSPLAGAEERVVPGCLLGMLVLWMGAGLISLWIWLDTLAS